MNDIQKPNLIESGIKGFYIETLKKCHKVREKYYNVVFNLSIFFHILLSVPHYCVLMCILDNERNHK